MSDTLAALTEKEKETLRLIVRGHDAKSAARELDLSVHTINERLRNARRKLGVTSSREAARVLLDDEGRSHENLVYNDLGDASRPAAANGAAATRPARSRAMWIGGIAVMLTLTIAAALAFATVQSSERAVGDPASPIETAQIETWESAARAWLDLVDASDWEASFTAAGQSFQDLNTVAMWRDASLQARVPLGDVIARETQTAEFVNAPPSGYVIVRFQSRFANKAGVTETVTLEREDDEWKVVGYVFE